MLCIFVYLCSYKSINIHSLLICLQRNNTAFLWYLFFAAKFLNLFERQNSNVTRRLDFQKINELVVYKNSILEHVSRHRYMYVYVYIPFKLIASIAVLP